jgi:hypothetical protein
MARAARSNRLLKELVDYWRAQRQGKMGHDSPWLFLGYQAEPINTTTGQRFSRPRSRIWRLDRSAWSFQGAVRSWLSGRCDTWRCSRSPRLRLTPDGKRHSVTVFFTLSMIRRHLETLGHGFMLSEIKEALDILSGTMMEIFLLDGDAAQQPRRTRTRSIKGTILTSYTKDFSEGDETGEASLVAMTFHQLVTAAILQMAYYPINALRVGKLKSTLARWLTTRMSHNYRQVRRNGWIDGDGYHISLETILSERGLVKEKRLRNNLDSVRGALAEMKEEKILCAWKPYDEKLTLAAGRGGRKIVGAVWTLYPSHEFVEEIIRGNEQMLENKELGQAESRGDPGGPGLWDDTSREK